MPEYAEIDDKTLSKKENYETQLIEIKSLQYFPTDDFDDEKPILI